MYFSNLLCIYIPALQKLSESLLRTLERGDMKKVLDVIVEMAKNWTQAEWDKNWATVGDYVFVHRDLLEDAKASVPVPKM